MVRVTPSLGVDTQTSNRNPRHPPSATSPPNCLIGVAACYLPATRSGASAGHYESKPEVRYLLRKLRKNGDYKQKSTALVLDVPDMT